MINIIDCFLKELEVEHTVGYTKELYEHHPYKNNFYGLSLILSEYSLKTYGIKIDSKNLSQLSFPCILHIGNDFVVARALQDKILEFWEHDRLKKSSVEEVEERWDGCALVAEYSEDASEADYHAHKKNEIIGYIKTYLSYFFVLAVMLYGIMKLQIYNDIGLLVSLIMSVLGFMLCVMLLKKQMHMSTRAGDTVCSAFGDGDCGKLLRTDAAKVCGDFSWSEVGFAYFISYIAFVFFYGRCTLLYILNGFAVVFSIWSIWYQLFHAKQKCVLCLCVQGMVMAGAASLFLTAEAFSLSGIIFEQMLLWFCIFTLIVIVVNKLSILISDKVLDDNKDESENAIKYDENVFRFLLKRQPHYDVSDEDAALCFGNRDSSLQVTVLSNPHCNPCALMHARLRKLLSRACGDICVQYILSYFSNIESNKVLIAAYVHNDRKTAEAIYDDWFDKGRVRPKKFMQDNGLDINGPAVEDIFARHEHWRRKTDLHATPTVLVNGYLLPKQYKVEDLIYFKDMKI